MKKIYIFGSKQDTFVQSLGFPFVQMDTPSLTSDVKIHDFIETHLTAVDFDTLIISCEQAKEIRFRIGYHIRLTDSLGSKRLCPLLYISNSTFQTILKTNPSYGHILLTEGCYFEQYSTEKIIKVVSLLKPLSERTYVTNFFERVKLQPERGGHSLANQWGALSLESAINSHLSNTSEELVKAQKQLYFKFILAKTKQHSKGEEENNHEVTRIDAKGKRIFYLDDEADKGWSAVLKELISVDKQDDLNIVQETVSGWDDLSIPSKELIKSGGFDLFLIDLRLNGEKEENLTNPKDFSGAKILQKIKELNAGNQVVMFTASNKAWNLKALLDMGADGYYIKESPEYAFPLKFSVENCKNLSSDINKCLSASYLRSIANLHSRIENHINQTFSSKSENFQKFFERTKANIQIAFELMKKTVEHQKYFNYSYLTYYQILEDYISQPEIFKGDQNGNYFVSHPIKGHVRVISRVGKTEQWTLTYRNPSFIKQQSAGDSTRYLQTNAKVSFVLAYAFDKGNFFLKNWGKLNEIRNSKAAHGGEKGDVSIEELNELLEVVELFLMRS